MEIKSQANIAQTQRNGGERAGEQPSARADEQTHGRLRGGEDHSSRFVLKLFTNKSILG